MIELRSKREGSKLSGRRFRWRLLVVGLLLTPVLAVTSLELLSRFYACPRGKSENSLPACDLRLYTNDTQNQDLLVSLTEKYGQGIAPTKAELDKAVFEIDRAFIGGNNGLVCNGVAFVSNDLPYEAKLFVKRHELEHVFQNLLQRQEKNPEFSANLAAAKEYPKGLISTTIFSIVKSRSAYPSFVCYIIGLWRIFKIYFLP
ncbi:MAG TPA: hypothetical protein VF896_16590 [Anaerolineales bacterium]